MKFVLPFLLAMCISVHGAGQNTQLVYLQTDLAGFSQFFPDGSGTYLRIHPPAATDASLLPTGAPYALNSTLNNGYFQVIYDENLAPVGHVEIAPFYFGFGTMSALKHDAGRHFLYSDKYVGFGFGPFTSNPELENDYPESIGHVYLLEYRAEENQLSMPFNCICPPISSEFAGAHSPHDNAEQNFGGFLLSPVGTSMAWLGDGTIAAVLNIFDYLTLNMDEEFSLGDDEKWGTVWVKFNPDNGTYIATPLVSETGTALNVRVDASSDGEHLYRLGLVSGQNPKISPDGTVWESTSDQEGFNEIILIKETNTGDHVWATPITALYDVGAPESQNPFSTNYDVSPIVELNSDVYVAMVYRFGISDPEAGLYFDDHFSDPTVYYKPEWFEMGPFPMPTQFIAKSAREVIRLDASGELLSKLSVPYGHPDPWHHDNLGVFYQESKLFEVNGKLAWPHPYTALSDTTIHVLKYSTNDDPDSTGIDLPEGRGIYVLWLDQNLDIQNHTLFSYSAPSASVNGVSILNIRAINEDTLLIDGKIAANTTTSLDPEGVAEEVTYSPGVGFLAMYSLPDFLIGTETPQLKREAYRLYPNPVSNVLHIEPTPKANPGPVTVFNITGQAILKIPDWDAETLRINTSEWKPGIYLIKIESSDGVQSLKFVKM